MFLATSGCATIAGIDQFSEGACAGGGDCDASVLDAGVDAKPSGDATVDAPKDQSSGGDTGTTSDASDGGTTTSDASDAGCGATNTITNCSGCGLACDVVHSNSPVCNGVTCGYGSCHQGYSDCNTTAPDTDGCECNTPSCCGSSCATTHDNGLGSKFYDCTALNTHNSTQAMEACAAYTGSQSLCSTSGCTGPGSNMVACGTINGICACWNYSGTNVGHVTTSTNSTCYCPVSTDPSWN
jgi:hypothetical protein